MCCRRKTKGLEMKIRRIVKKSQFLSARLLSKHLKHHRTTISNRLKSMNFKRRSITKIPHFLSENNKKQNQYVNRDFKHTKHNEII